eukprot:TRINITY_DN5780_c0_g1_i1.p1 TRINITY_DN5780_c0_g1~~TRINITY_DN5780_c0_g1_i1.p1  ORF type:complete len:330 (+),score=19.72 TRINITY_DN5780_c0_g1_i1:737-1726(+)
MAVFKRYPTIANVNSEKELSLVRRFNHQDVWVVQEKIDGANMALTVAIDGECYVSSRNMMLGQIDDPNLTFFGCQDFIRTLKCKALAVFDHYKRMHSVRITGELAGGFYEHANCRDMPRGNRIRPGKLQYAPWNIFCAFDLEVDDEYQPVSETERVLRESGFFVPVIEKQGTLEECLAYSGANKQRCTSIPARLGLPERDGNTREGHVLRPECRFVLPSGSRAILKDRNYTDEAVEKKANLDVANRLRAMQTADRCASVVSKWNNPPEKSDLSRLVKEMVSDALEELGRERPEEIDSFHELSDGDRKTVLHAANKSASQVALAYIRDWQ